MSEAITTVTTGTTIDGNNYAQDPIPLQVRVSQDAGSCHMSEHSLKVGLARSFSGSARRQQNVAVHVTPAILTGFM